MNTLLCASALTVAFCAACQSTDEKVESKGNDEPTKPSFVGRWRYEAESVNMECAGTKLERDVEPRRPVEFLDREGTLTLASETCRVPLVVEGKQATSDTPSECPWVDGMTVKMTSVRAELLSSKRVSLVTETQILGKHPQAPDTVFDCSATSNGVLIRVGP